MQKLVYPACFYPYSNEDGNGYTVMVPDLPGCVTGGESLAEAIEMGVDAASGWVLTEMEDGKPIPAASKPEDISADEEPNGFVSMLVLDMDTYAEKYGNNAVRTNLTIPAWQNTFVEQKNLNVSRILQDALSAMYLKQSPSL